MINKLLNLYYTYVLAEQRFLRWLVAVPSYVHLVTHSFVATACRVPNWPHKQIAELYFYFFAFSVMQQLPNPLAGWYFLHMAYGAGYYQYRLTLIGVVDNFKVVPLHAWGYLTWRKFWRLRLYPWLVKRFPRWGYFTTLLVWCQHLFVGQGITKFFSVKMLALTRLTLLFRYGTPRLTKGVHNSSLRPSQLHLLKEIKTPVGSLVDRETLSLDLAFTSSRYEPFQEEAFGYFDDQQDVTQEEDDEPQQTFDIQYGTNEGGHVYHDDNYYLFRDTRRPRPNTVRKVQPYRQVTNEVLNFNLNSTYAQKGLSKNSLTSLGRLLDPGQGPTTLDEEPGLDGLDDESDPGEQRQELADWYFFAQETRHISDLDLLQSDVGEIWRNTYNMWTPGVITHPWRGYSIARGWRRWWWWSRRLQTRRYYKQGYKHGRFLKPLRTVKQARQWRRLRKKKGATHKTGETPSRWSSTWWLRNRRSSESRWTNFDLLFDNYSFFVSRGYTHGIRRLTRQWKKLKKRWLNTDIEGYPVSPNQLCPRFIARRQEVLMPSLSFFKKGVLPTYRWISRAKRWKGATRIRWIFMSNRWGSGWVFDGKSKKKTPGLRSVYPRYQPAYTARTNNLITSFEPGAYSGIPSTGFVLIVFIALVSCLDVPFYFSDWSEDKFNDIYLDNQPESLYRWVQPGLFTWSEIYRLEPPRGIHSWPINPGGIDSNLYVWGWWVNFWATSWHHEVYSTCPDPQLVSYSTWKWFADPTPLDWFIASWAPYIPSWAHLIGKIGTTLAYTPGLEEIEMPTRFRELDNQYFRVQGLPHWIISQIYNSEDQFRAAAVHFPIRTDAQQLLWHNHLANPVWVNPRDLYPYQKVHLDARYLNFWEVSTQLANQVSDTGFYRGSFYNLGRANATQMWPRYMEDSVQGWARFNLPGKWETSWNTQLIENWRQEAKDCYAVSRPFRHEFAWVADMYGRIVSRFPSEFSPFQLQLLLWYARAAAVTMGITFIVRSSWFVPTQGLTTVLSVEPTTRLTSSVQTISRSSKSFLKVFAPHRVSQTFKVQVTTRGELPNYDKFEFGVDRPVSWRWNRWSHAFGVVRQWPQHNKFFSAGSGRTRRSPPQKINSNFCFSVFHPEVKKTSLAKEVFLTSANSTALRGWWTAKAVPWATVKPEFSFSATRIVPLVQTNLKHKTFLFRPGIIDDYGSSTLPSKQQRPRANTKRWLKAYRLVNQDGLRPRQYHKIDKRYLDGVTRENTRPTTQAPPFIVSTRAMPVTSVFMVKTQQNNMVRKWSRWVSLVGNPTPASEADMTASIFFLVRSLTEVNYPGRTTVFHQRTQPYPTGTNFGVYEDDHNNEPFVGHQSDEEFDEMEEVDNPFETYNDLLTTTEVTTAVVTYKTGLETLNNRAYCLLSWSRWCGLPLGWYSQPQTGVTSTYSRGWKVELCDWAPLAADHPALNIVSGLTSYEIPRLYRRLTVWSTSLVPPPRRAPYCDPWGKTRAARAARVGLAGLGFYRSRFRQPWWRHQRDNWVLQRHFGEDGGDPSGWPTIAAHLWDELQQTGWGPHSLAPGEGYHQDNVDSVGVGHFNEMAYCDHTYRIYLVKGLGRLHYSGIRWTHSENNGGVNLDVVGTPAEVLFPVEEKQVAPDPEHVLFEWWTPPTWIDAYSDEATWIDFYGFERDPEDAFDHPADGEHNPEVARPRVKDLPTWVVAAAVAGAGSTSFDAAATPAAARPGIRVWGSLWARHTYYTTWLQSYGEDQPWWWRRRWPIGPTNVGAADWAQEKSELTNGVTPAGVPSVAGNPLMINLDDHIRVWAITEVYLRDLPHGRGTTG